MPQTESGIVFNVEGTTTLSVEDVSTHLFELREDSENNTLKISPQADFLVGKVATDPAVIMGGTTIRLNVPIENIGNKDAESVKAILKTKSFFTGAKTDYLGDIKQSLEKIATFELKADRDTIPDNYETDIKIIWTDGDERLEEI